MRTLRKRVWGAYNNVPIMRNATLHGSKCILLYMGWAQALVTSLCLHNVDRRQAPLAIWDSEAVAEGFLLYLELAVASLPRVGWQAPPRSRKHSILSWSSRSCIQPHLP